MPVKRRGYYLSNDHKNAPIQDLSCLSPKTDPFAIDRWKRCVLNMKNCRGEIFEWTTHQNQTKLMSKKRTMITMVQVLTISNRLIAKPSSIWSNRLTHDVQPICSSSVGLVETLVFLFPCTDSQNRSLSGRKMPRIEWSCLGGNKTGLSGLAVYTTLYVNRSELTHGPKIIERICRSSIGQLYRLIFCCFEEKSSLKYFWST